MAISADELVGQPLELLVPVESRTRTPCAHACTSITCKPAHGPGLNLEARRKGGVAFPVEIGLSAIETAQGKLAIAFISDISERRELENAATAHAKEIQALAASLLTAQEEERRRVSRELHDQICQQLASLAIDMGGLSADPQLPREYQGRLKALQSRAIRASDDTRHLAYELHSSVLEDLGLVASLQDLAQEFSHRTGISVKVSHQRLPRALPREVALVSIESRKRVCKISRSTRARAMLRSL